MKLEHIRFDSVQVLVDFFVEARPNEDVAQLQLGHDRRQGREATALQKRFRLVGEGFHETIAIMVPEDANDEGLGRGGCDPGRTRKKALRQIVDLLIVRKAKQRLLVCMKNNKTSDMFDGNDFVQHVHHHDSTRHADQATAAVGCLSLLAERISSKQLHLQAKFRFERCFLFFVGIQHNDQVLWLVKDLEQLMNERAQPQAAGKQEKDVGLIRRRQMRQESSLERQ